MRGSVIEADFTMSVVLSVEPSSTTNTSQSYDWDDRYSVTDFNVGPSRFSSL